MTLKGLFEKTVFLIGGGASMDAGCLSSKQMQEDLKMKINSLPISDMRRKPFRGIYEFIISSLNYQNTLKSFDKDQALNDINIEDFILVLRQLIDREFIIPQPLVGSWNDKIIKWEVQDENIFSSFLTFVTDLLIDKWTKYDEGLANDLVQPFRDLINLQDDFKIDIFSLNYDVIWEKIFNSETERLIETGFSGGHWTGEFDDENYPSKITLSKLHGSVDWYFDQETEEVLVSTKAVDDPVIIFGSSNKMQSFDPFITLLSRFRQRLQTSTLYVIVGYSFQDRYINNILIQSLNSQLARTAIIIDPIMWETEEELVDKVEITQSSKSLNEMINLTRINPQRIEVLRLTANEFYKEYLGDEASKLKEKLEIIEKGETTF